MIVPQYYTGMGTMEAGQEYRNEPPSGSEETVIPAAIRTTECAGVTAASDEDNLSSSEQAFMRAQTEADKLTSDELHKELVGTYVSIGENCIIYQTLVLSAKNRMQVGEKVGGCNTWKGYANTFLKHHEESLPTCLRRLRRLLEGVNPDEKHRNHRKKSDRQIVEEGIDGQHAIELRQAREKGFEEGWAAGRKDQELLSKKAEELGATFDPNPGVRLPSSVTAELTTFYAGLIAKLKALTKCLKSNPEPDALVKTEAQELVRALRTFSKDAADRAERLDEALRVKVQ
jgi:hypothetical protein